MKKKFDGYTIEVINKVKRKLEPDLYRCSVDLKGDIEIGLHIDAWTWRGDWILKLFFKDDYMKYSIRCIENNEALDSNHVVILVRQDKM